jgi:SAM-dependent methyltransferase
MGFSLEKIVPWGRSFQEYGEMFALTADDLKRTILGCGDGPASFNASLTQQGGKVVSLDPIYEFSTTQIKTRVDETYATVLAQLEKNQADFVWNKISAVAELGEIRMAAMNLFLADYENGKQQNRYVAGELPLLPFADGQFDLALSSHFLFLYSEHLSCDFHLQALQEMLRVAREIRVFPLLTLDAKPSPHLESVMDFFKQNNFQLEIKQVDYEFQRGANQMLVIMQNL